MISPSEYLHLFQTEQQHQQAYNGNAYSEPWIGYDTQSGDVTYNKKKRRVTLTSATDVKVFDGTSLTNDSITVSGDGFADGDGATYGVTGTQTLVGHSENEFTYTLNQGTRAGDYEITSVFGTLTVTDGQNPDDTEEVMEDLVVTVVLPRNMREHVYRLGEEIEYNVSAYNIYESAAEIELSAPAGFILSSDSDETMGGDHFSTTLTHTVGESDLIAGGVDARVTAYVGRVTANASCEDAIIEGANASLNLTIETTSTPLNESEYTLGEEIEYEVTVTNDGNITLYNIAVTAELESEVRNYASLEPLHSETFTLSHTVDADDVTARSVTQCVTGTASTVNGEEADVNEDCAEDPVEGTAMQ